MIGESEHTLSAGQVVERADRARRLLDDETFVEVTATLRAEYTQDWIGAETTEAREHAWYKVQALRDVQRALHKIVDDGEILRTRSRSADAPRKRLSDVR